LSSAGYYYLYVSTADFKIIVSRPCANKSACKPIEFTKNETQMVVGIVSKMGENI